MAFMRVSVTSSSMGAGDGAARAHRAELLTTFDLMGTEHITGALAYRMGIVNFQFNYSYNRPNDAPLARSSGSRRL